LTSPSTLGKLANQITLDEAGEADSDRGGRKPAGELEFLHALADHDEQDEAERDAVATSMRR